MTPQTPRLLPDWPPSASHDLIRMRARMLARIREFFAQRDVLEVETPILSRAGSVDPHIESMAATTPAPRYLQTSPEFPMKRLLAAGAGDIYQICKAFRAGEQGRFHNPEFTLLEWYRMGFDYRALMAEVDTLLRHALGAHRGATLEISYRDAFLEHAGLDPFSATQDSLAACAAANQLDVEGDLDQDGWLDLLMSRLVAPRFSTECFTFVFDYPASQAALARVRPEPVPVAERFEVFLGDVELANGFAELTDPAEQRQRFVADQAARRAAGMAPVPFDEYLLSALKAGLPVCSGVAVGLDRLLMIAGGAAHINEVLTFSWGRV